MMNPLLLPIVAAIALTSFLPPAKARGEWTMEILDQEWHLAGFENSLDLSGIAAATANQVLVGSDESFYIQPGTLQPDKHRIESQRPIALPVESGRKKAEIDIEGVAWCKEVHSYYVVGSHGLGKKKADFQVERHAVYQIPVDPESGRIRKDAIRRTSLLPWIEKTPLLAPYLKKPLQQNGFNIEGLTSSNGRLYIGLRAPNKSGNGVVIDLAAVDLFNGKPTPLVCHRVDIGEGRGIREIAAVRGGFILVTGNASAESSKKIPDTLAVEPDNRFELRFWNGKNPSSRIIGSLPRNEGKAEALLLLSDTDEHVELLVIFDGLPGGQPLAIRLKR
jgi:hypothetical protein